ncbi:MAG: hypothetical protein N2323_00970 [candidate division WOR-3 bacterium]|nr:hypothetical protein [candidate division WOR-3 bacterium]
MKKLIFLVLPLFVFSYYDFSLRKYSEISELLEDPYVDYYLNPALLTELKERFLSFSIYGSNGKAQFTNLSFLNINKLLPYALIFNNFETEFSSEKSLSLLLARKRKDYSYGFKFQIGEIRNFYEDHFNYEESEYYLETEGPIGDSTEDYFFFENHYDLEKTLSKEIFSYYEKSTLLFFPFSFYLKFKDLEVGIDLKNSVEKRIKADKEEGEVLEIREEYSYEKNGDTTLNFLEEYLISEINFDNYRTETIETLKVWNKDISLFLRKRFKGIKEKKILFNKIGYSFEITKGVSYEKALENIYESLLEWEKSYEDGEWYLESSFEEDSSSTKEEWRELIAEKKENLYQEGGFGFTYYFSFLKLDNTIFLGVKEKIDLIKKEEKKWEKKGKVLFYLGNNFEKGKFSFLPIFIPYWTFEEDKTENDNKIKVSYNYQVFFDLKFKLFDFLTGRLSYLLPAEKEAYKRWILSLYLNY